MLKEDLIIAIHNLNADDVKDILDKISDKELNNYEENDYTVLHQIADTDLSGKDWFGKKENYKIFDALIIRLDPITINKITKNNTSALELAIDSENNHIASSLISYAMDIETIDRVETYARLDFSDLIETNLREIKRLHHKIISNDRIIKAIKEQDIERIKSLFKQRNLYYPNDLYYITDRDGRRGDYYAREFIK